MMITIDEHGISIPTFAEYREGLVADMKVIFGEDIWVEPDSQDGQMLDIFAFAMIETAQAIARAYHSFGPNEAIGVGLSRLVKINGIRRRSATNSQVDVVLIGTAGTVIRNGRVGDTFNNQWVLPSTITIPSSGEIIVTATSRVAGGIRIQPGDVNKILTPTRGWQSVNSPDASVPGQPVETDYDLRIRQTESVSLPSLSVLGGITGAVLDLPDVVRGKVYENDTSVTDINGIPPHSICAVIDGGNVSDIGNRIFLKKTPGTGTYGDIQVSVEDEQGISNTIRFFRPTQIPIEIHITLSAAANYNGDTTDSIIRKLVDHINTLSIGSDVILNQLYTIIYSADVAGPIKTFVVSTLAAAVSGGTPGSSNIVVAFNAASLLSPDSVHVTIN